MTTHYVHWQPFGNGAVSQPDTYILGTRALRVVKFLSKNSESGVEAYPSSRGIAIASVPSPADCIV